MQNEITYTGMLNAAAAFLATRIEIVDKNNAVTTPLYEGIGDLIDDALLCEHNFVDIPAPKKDVDGVRLFRQHCDKCHIAIRVRLQTICSDDDIEQLISSIPQPPPPPTGPG